jgi:hypothetical protein
MPLLSLLKMLAVPRDRALEGSITREMGAFGALEKPAPCRVIVNVTES